MHRMHPKARRATALTLLTSLFLVLAAACAVAFHATPASASSSAATPSPIVGSRIPLAGDPNTPDEGRGSGVNVLTTTSPVRTFLDWVKGFAHPYFLPLR